MPFSSPLGLVLASSSSYRRTLLDRLGLGFNVCPAELDETPLPGEAPQAVARRLASAKARAIAPRFPNHLIIGSDQVATLDDITILGKPLTHENAVAQLGRLSGQRACFYTAACLFNSCTNVLRAAIVPTVVEFRPLSHTTIEAYLHRERPYDCTGSAKIEGLGIALVRKVVSDDPSALIGLPLIALQDMLEAEGVFVV
jgi:septum formation protein